MTRLIPALSLLVLLLAACSSFEPPQPSPKVTITGRSVSLDGRTGWALIDVETSAPVRLTVTYNTHTTLVDTTLTDRAHVKGEWSLSKGWGHPPGPFGDVFTATLLDGDGAIIAQDEVQSLDRMPSPNQ